MKHISISLCLISLLAVACNTQEDEGLVCISEELQDRIVLEYADALNEFAQLTPLIGGDNESYWAAEECDKIARSVKKNTGWPFLKRMSGIYKMQAYCGYSFTYAISCWAKSGNEDGTADMAIRSASVADDLYDEIRKGGFTDYNKVFKLACYSFFYIQLYSHLINDLATRDGDAPLFQEDDLGLSISAVSYMDSLSALGIPKDVIFRIGSVMETVSFHQTFAPLVQGFTQSEEQFASQKPTVEDFSNFCDSVSAPLYSCFYDSAPESKVPEGKAFEEFMEQSLEYKTKMLRMLCDNIRTYSDSEDDNQ